MLRIYNSLIARSTDRLWQQTLCACVAMTRPVIAVLGATGSQGGSVVAALLKQDKFLVRAVTRNAAKAGDLGNKQNVEVVEADMGDKASLVKVCMLGHYTVQQNFHAHTSHCGCWVPCQSVMRTAMLTSQRDSKVLLPWLQAFAGAAGACRL